MKWAQVADPQELKTDYHALLRRFRSVIEPSTYGTSISSILPSLAKAIQHLNPNPRTDVYVRSRWVKEEIEDEDNVLRDWGTAILSRDHAAFSDPEYLADRLRAAGQVGTGMVYDPTAAYKDFLEVWETLSGGRSSPVAFAINGSTAVNMMVTVANWALRVRDGGYKELIPRADVLHIDGVYGAGYGDFAGVKKGAGTGDIYHAFAENPKNKIPGPYIYRSRHKFSNI